MGVKEHRSVGLLEIAIFFSSIAASTKRIAVSAA
jgi:hypothetical protein